MSCCSSQSTQSLDFSPFEPELPHDEKICNAIAPTGAKINSSGLWINFWIGEEAPSLGVFEHIFAKHQWRILLNPTREHLYDVVNRSIMAMRKACLPVGGAVVGKDTERRSQQSVLDDPCEPKLMFCCPESSFVQSIEVLEREFPEEEQKRLACSEGKRYRDGLGACVAQWGPSFTRMKSPFLFYQQGGFVESGRACIVHEELEKIRTGLEDSLEAYQRIQKRLARFFGGENFYRYEGSFDPFGSLSPQIPLNVDETIADAWAGPDFKGRQISWLSGSSTASLPPIFHTREGALPSLIPTGFLLQTGVPPMCGELEVGICPNGLNRRALSGVGADHSYVALEYAMRAKPFNQAKERLFLQNLHQVPQEGMARAKIAAMRLVHMGLEPNERAVLERFLQAMIDTLVPSEAPKAGWERFLPLVGKSAAAELFEPDSAVERDTIVGVMVPYQGMVFGVVVRSTLSGEVCVRWNSAGEEVFCARWMVFPVKGAFEDFCSRIGQPFSEELMLEEPLLQPGALLAFPGDDGRGTYVMVAAVRDGDVELFDGPDRTMSIPRVRARRLIAPPEDFLERELQKEPVLMDEAYAALRARSFMQGRRESIEEILHIIEAASAITWDRRERAFIEEPSAVVFGSVTANPAVFHNGVSGELILEGPQEMGRDIQLIFVPEKRVSEIQEYVLQHMPAAFGVRVLPLSSLS